MARVDIDGLDRGAVLSALYNASRPVGNGRLQARGPLTEAEARQVLRDGDDARRQFGPSPRRPAERFDYLFGRPLKIDLSGTSFRSDEYDAANGAPGMAAEIVAALREATDNESR